MRHVRLLATAALLGGGTGCMSLDFMFLDNPQLDAYDLSKLDVPAELVEAVTFDRGDGVMLAGVWARQDATTPSRPLIYFHGTSNHVQHGFDRLAYYWSWGQHDVFAVDYAGFGPSEGEATWDALARHDGVGTLDYVSDLTGFPHDEIDVVALSLGGFVAIHAADDRSPRAMVLESVFASSDLLVDRSLQLDVPPGWFFEEDWENVDAIAKVETPVFVIHGLADDFVMPASGPMLYDAAAGPKELWQPADVNHTTLFEVLPDAYRDRALAFYERYP